MKLLAIVTVLLILAPGCDQPTTNRPSAANGSASVQPNNTAVNERDRDRETKTPIDQNENQADVSTTANIRKQVVDTKMSVDAQNVKIITQDGKVTLRGPVDSDQEKQKIEDIARSVAGAGNVDSQLEVKQR
jgi:hyperosmotically inducible periplasmic protein